MCIRDSPSNATQVGYLSYAIWSLFDKNALNGLSTTQLAGVNSWLSNVPLNLTTSQFSNFVILTPQGCTPGTCPGQEFLQLTVPEGGSATIYLLIAGLACFAAMRFRPRRPAPIAGDGLS